MTQAAPVPDRTFDAEALIDAAAPLLGLSVAADYRAGVRANLETARRMAGLLERVPLTDGSEPAPVFRA